MLTERQFDAGALTINYAEGAANGSPLISLHGGTARWQELNPLITELEHRWHVYACDQRGHGKSDRAAVYRVVDFFPDTTAGAR
jgi:pimeloyl-ACP methyl ester carboxylesterase